MTSPPTLCDQCFRPAAECYGFDDCLGASRDYWRAQAEGLRARINAAHGVHNEELFSFGPDRLGDHVHVTVRHGIEGQRGLLGKLVMRVEEWQQLATLLLVDDEGFVGSASTVVPALLEALDADDDTGRDS